MILTAIPVVKNKFWIVSDDDGHRVASIQSSINGVTYVQHDKREHFVSINLLKEKYNINFDKAKKAKSSEDVFSDVGGFPCDGYPYNAVFDLSRKLPIFTKARNSKSFYCAGYYLIKYKNDYVREYCPKLITLDRYEFAGPFIDDSHLEDFQSCSKL
jgi:hypothetical protein